MHLDRSTRRRYGRPPSAFTLVEVLTSITLAAVLMLALTSSMMIASRAIPDADDGQVNTALAVAVLEELLSDASCATHVLSASDTSITLLLPDRNNDGHHEIIRYSWAGSAGDPVTRQVNAGANATLLETVTNLTFTLEASQTQRMLPGAYVEGAERKLSEFWSDDTSLDLRLGANAPVAQLLKPQTSGDAAYYRPTRLLIYAQQLSLLSGTTALLNDLNDRAEPGATLANANTGPLSPLGLLGWNTFDFDSAPWIDASTSVYLQMQTGGGALRLATDEGGDAVALKSSDGGATWQPAEQTITHEMYGVELTPRASTNWTTSQYTRLRVSLTPSSADDSTVLSTAVSLPNRPPMVSDFWQATFDDDPTAQDANGDSKADWAITTGEAFDTAALSDGEWAMRQILMSYPSRALTSPATIRLRCRSDTPNVGGPVLWISTGGNGSNPGVIGVHVASDDDATQYVELRTIDDDNAMSALVPAFKAGDGTVDLTLRIRPIPRTVHLVINGKDVGTFQYNRMNGDLGYRGTLLFPDGEGAVVDELSVQVWDTSS
ncbi:MAG: prepilin-type N-terminal cleavage/methylation domain-containing protein [Rhodospirillales bacterium]|nr:prepilin-type N-terminal cleavage/methylation domain-containing protein [Rhodospirillales bacterium]